MIRRGLAADLVNPTRSGSEEVRNVPRYSTSTKQIENAIAGWLGQAAAGSVRCSLYTPNDNKVVVETIIGESIVQALGQLGWGIPDRSSGQRLSLSANEKSWLLTTVIGLVNKRLSERVGDRGAVMFNGNIVKQPAVCPAYT